MPVSKDINSFSPIAEEFMGPDEINFKSSEYDVLMSAYMCSVQGTDKYGNYDNYYINGMCEKSFSFSNMEKSIDSFYSRHGIFAVSTGISSERASKVLMRLFDEKKELLSSSRNVFQLKKRLSKAIVDCGINLAREGEQEGENFEAAFAVGVYYKTYFLYAVCGDAAAVYMKNGSVKRLKSGYGNLGVRQYNMPYIGMLEFNPEDRLIFLSKGAINAGNPEELCCQIMNESKTKNIARRLSAFISFNNTQDTTCMAVSAEPQRGIHSSTLITAGISILITLFNIFMIILN